MKKALLHTEFKKQTRISGYPKEQEEVVMKITELSKKRIALELDAYYETFDVQYDDEPEIKRWKEIWKGDILEKNDNEGFIKIVVDYIWIEGLYEENKEYERSALRNYDDTLALNSPVYTCELILKTKEQTYLITRTQHPDYKPSEEFLEQERKKVGWEMSWHKSGIDPRDHPYPED